MGFLGAGWGTKFAWFGPIVSRLPRSTVLPRTPTAVSTPTNLPVRWCFFCLSLRPVCGLVARAAVVARFAEPRRVGAGVWHAALTQSRSGWLGGAAGLLALAMLAGLASRQRRLHVLAVALPLALILAFGEFFALRRYRRPVFRRPGRDHRRDLVFRPARDLVPLILPSRIFRSQAPAWAPFGGW